VLISVSFVHIIPKSFQMNSTAPAFLVGGFLAIHLSNRFLNAYICNEYECVDYAVGVIPMLGIGLHSFIDGVIYSVTFNVSIFTGMLAAIGMILHEFPEGIVTFVLLGRGGGQPTAVSQICLSRSSSIYTARNAGILSLHQPHQAVHFGYIAGYLRWRTGLCGRLPLASRSRKREQEIQYLCTGRRGAGRRHHRHVQELIGKALGQQTGPVSNEMPHANAEA